MKSAAPANGTLPSAFSHETAWRDAAADYPSQPRMDLPPAQQAQEKPSLWSMAKTMLAGDLYNAQLPIAAYEPVTELQRRVESFAYTELLDQAATAPKGSVKRLMLVAAYLAAGCSDSAAHASAKSVNPSQCETYELLLPEKQAWILGEAVYQDRTDNNQYVTAYHGEGRQWVLQSETEFKVRYIVAASGMEIDFHWFERVTFADGEAFDYRRPVSMLYGLVVNRPYISITDDIRITSSTANTEALVKFREPKTLAVRSTAPHEVKASVEHDGKRLAGMALKGNWMEGPLVLEQDGKSKALWRRPPPPDGCRFSMGCMGLRLNQTTPAMQAKLPPTDSRKRKDVRAIEHGQFDQAEKEMRRIGAKNVAEYVSRPPVGPRGGRSSVSARWFGLMRPNALESIPGGTALRYRYKGGYWNARAKGEWSNCIDIFGPAKTS